MKVNWVFLQTAIDKIANSMRNGSTRELETVVLVGFSGTDSFKLTFDGAESAAITRGTNYDAAGIKAAIEGIAGFPDTVTVSDVTDSAFLVQFNSPGPPGSVLSVTNPTGVTGTVGILVAGEDADPDETLSLKGAVAHLGVADVPATPTTDPATLTEASFDGYAVSAGIEWADPYVGPLGVVTFNGGMIQWTCTGDTVTETVYTVRLVKDGETIAVGRFDSPIAIDGEGKVVVLFPQVTLPAISWASAA